LRRLQVAVAADGEDFSDWQAFLLKANFEFSFSMPLD